MNQTTTGQGLNQKRGEEAESEAEIEERNIGTLKTDNHLEGSRPHSDIHLYESPEQLHAKESTMNK